MGFCSISSKAAMVCVGLGGGGLALATCRRSGTGDINHLACAKSFYQ